MALIAVMKIEKKVHQMLTSSHNLSSCFYKVCRFPFWVLMPCNGILQIIFTACYFSSQTSSYSSSTYFNKKQKYGWVNGKQTSCMNMAAHFFPAKSVHMPNMLLHLILSGLITHAHMVCMRNPDCVFVATVYSFRDIQHFRRVQHLWVQCLLVTFWPWASENEMCIYIINATTKS